MAIETPADRAVFVNADEFGAVVTYTSILTGLPVEISAIWFEPSGGVAINAIATDTAQPELCFRTIDVPDPREGDTVVRASDGRTMQVATPILPDGEGFTVCALVAVDDC